MKTLYIECNMGAAGDMLTAALLELTKDPDEFLKKLNALNIPKVTVTKEKSVKCGITGTHVSVKVDGIEEDENMHDHHHHHDDDHDHDHEHHHDHDHEHEHHHDHDHEHHHDHDHEHHHDHDHEHEHHHHHSSMHDIEHIVEDLNVSDKVKKDVLAVYSLIAEAESHAHDTPVSEIHFHEVGTMDAIADVTAVCLLMEELAPENVVVSPVHVGSGQVKCAHGILPVPAPATAYILKDCPIYGGAVRGELCTPTGAALLKHFATKFGNMPVRKVSGVGYGIGKKDFETANCVRVMLGETDSGSDTVTELSCNMDDMTAEDLGFATVKLFEEGALEVFTVPVGMKKNRPGTLLTVLCKNADTDRIVRAIFKYTSTIGIRKHVVERYTLERKTEDVETPYGNIKKKISSGYGVTREKFEYDDLAKIASEKNISVAEVRKVIDENR